MKEVALSGQNESFSLPLFITAGACAALFAANLYYAQPLLTTIAADLGLHSQFAGSVVSASQLGYGLGLFLLVPLSDLVENRRLVLICSFLTVVGIIGIACSRSATSFLISALLVGIFSSGAQVLIPYLSHLMPAARRGRLLGALMAGILTCIVFARPLALFVAAMWGWRSIYAMSACVSAALGLALWRMMPPRCPDNSTAYWPMIGSMLHLFARQAGVRRRTLYQAILFGCFTMFWAAIPILLAEQFALSQPAIGLFALVGAGGVIAAPLAGHISDGGGTRLGTLIASLCVAGAFLSSILSLHFLALFGLAIGSFIIDGSIQVSQILGRIIILDVPPEIRGRINAVYMTCIYLSGAFGSMLGVSLYFWGGWLAVAATGSVGGFVVCLAATAERPAVTRMGVS